MENKKVVKLKIDNKDITAWQGQTILQVARENNIDIPALCFHEDLKPSSSCRLCVVKIVGQEGVVTSCDTQVQDGQEIITDSPELERIRKTNLELLFAQHEEECQDCVLQKRCEMLKLAKRFNIRISRFLDRKKNFKDYQFGPSIIFDASKCIDCGNCIQVCKNQGVSFLEARKQDKKNNFHQVCPVTDKSKDCIYCGQCITHCPAGAFEAVGEYEKIKDPLQEKDKIVIFQFAPSIRVSIGEEFDLPYGFVVTDQLVSAIKYLGANYVFDVSVGADFTTCEEALELMERLKNPEKLPMFTSCCPAWVKMVEFKYPELIPHLTTVRSPHMILGGLIKTYWAAEHGFDPEKIVVVSVMPCTAKKYEIQRQELFVKGLGVKIKPVDYVLTTRELAFLLKDKDIDLKEMKPVKADNILGNPSGAGVIYGASGGVMESALRTAYEKMTGKVLEDVEFNQVRGLKGVKDSIIKIKDRLVRIGVVNGMGNAVKLVQEIEQDRELYDYIEVMACPGGCIGGGGQPVPFDMDTVERRRKALYQIDSGKSVRKAHDNPVVKKLYNEFLNDKEICHSLCHTGYITKEREN